MTAKGQAMNMVERGTDLIITLSNHDIRTIGIVMVAISVVSLTFSSIKDNGLR